jgi:hypothetical protein
MYTYNTLMYVRFLSCTVGTTIVNVFINYNKNDKQKYFNLLHKCCRGQHCQMHTIYDNATLIGL